MVPGYFSIILTEDLRFTVYPGDYLGFEGDTIAVRLNKSYISYNTAILSI